jgi:tetratricopeptide (TPR) repeat protein
MNTEFCKSDLTELGIDKNSFFEVGYKNKVYKILWGTTYSDVSYGMWVAFLNSEGFLKIARNYKNAASLLKCAKGDEIFIQKRNSQILQETNAKSDSLGGMAWFKLLENKPAEAEEFAKQALEITPNKKWILMNLAHSYLLSNRFEEAKEIYEAHKGSRIMDGSFYFEDMVIEDIEEMRKEKIENKHFDKILEMMK